MRAVGRIRLSRLTDESTSVDRQREAIEAWAKMHGHEIIGWAVDTDVSGGLSPFEAPELAPWLTPTRSDEWDILVAYRLDRFARRVIPLNQLFGWVLDRGKSLASVSESIDLSTWVGRLVANVIAGVAEGELEAIRERTSSSQRKLRELGRWHGGVPPYGYRAEKREGATGRWLVPDPAQAEVVRRIFRWYTDDGWSERKIAAELNRTGVEPPLRAARSEKHFWWDRSVSAILQSRAAIGQREYRGVIVRDADGMPAQRAEPIITPEMWRAAQDARSTRSRPRTQVGDRALLLGFAYCSECDSRLWRNRSRYRWYYRCSSAKFEPCAAARYGIPAEQIEGLIEETLLDRIGAIEIIEEVYVPGTGSAEQLAHVRDAIKTARKEYDAGLYDGDESGYLDRVSMLSTRRRELEMLGDGSPRWEHRGTGVTWAERWQAADTVDARRAVIRDSGITVRARWNPAQFAVDVPEDRLEGSFPGYEFRPPTAD